MNGIGQTKRVNTETQKAIVQQLVSDSELTNACVREEGGSSKVVSIETMDLNRDGKPEFLVYGRTGVHVEPVVALFGFLERRVPTTKCC